MIIIISVRIIEIFVLMFWFKNCDNCYKSYCYIIPYNSLADLVRLLAERSDTKSNVKLGRFWSQLQASNVSSHSEELWYNEAVCGWQVFDPGFERPACLATLKSSDRTKQSVCGWQVFDPGFERPACLATLKSSDRTKQSVCGWQVFDPGFERPACLATLNSSDRTKQSACGWPYIE